MDEKRINKCLKSYMVAKKYYDNDMDKSFEYFKECMKILNEIKDNKVKIKDELIPIINETETECVKYISKTIKINIEKPLIKKPHGTNSELFEIIQTGNIERIKKYNYGDINFNVYNDEGYSPLHYAIIFGDTLFIKHALKLGACIDQTNLYGHTLLEFACLEKDPNMINFLLFYGANMKKHLLFRRNKKYFNSGYEIDNILIEIFILESIKSENNIKHLDWIFKYIDKNDTINIELSKKNNSTISESKIDFKTFIIKLDNLIDTFDKESRDTFISIIKEELEYDLIYKLGCPRKKTDIILYNLLPFINFEQVQLSWLISLEVKYLILKLFKNNPRINFKELKNELNDLLYHKYVETELYTEGVIQIIIMNWINILKM